jgi:hypothetical protein
LRIAGYQPNRSDAAAMPGRARRAGGGSEARIVTPEMTLRDRDRPGPVSL